MFSGNPKVDKLLHQFQGGNNPYAFSVHKELKQERYSPTPEETIIIREQHKTLFQQDEAMQRTFKNNFEEYFKAVENPDLMLQRMEERMREIDKDIAERQARGEFPEWQMDDSFMEGMESEIDLDDLEFDPREEEDASRSFEQDSWDSPFDDDPLYQKAHEWFMSFHKECHEIYDKQGKKDPDLFRVIINSSMVSAKIVFGSSYGEAEEEDLELAAIAAEVDMKGYTLANIFLSRARESLKNLVHKGFEPVDMWQKALSGADDISIELQSRMVELAKKIRSGK